MSVFGSARPEGANHLWRKKPPRELSIDLVVDERLGRMTGRAGASSQRSPWAPECRYRSDDAEHQAPLCRACEGLLVFISLTKTDARFLGEAKQRKTEEECGKHEKQASAIGVL